VSPIPVLFLEPTLGPGGAERILFELVTRLDRNRFAPVVCCLREPGHFGEALIAAGVPTHHGILKSRYSLAPAPALIRLIRREGIQIVHTTNQPLNTTWAVVAGRLAGIPVQVTTVHGMRGLPRQRERRMINRALLPFVDAVIALSDVHRDYLVNEDGIVARKVRVVRNGIDLDQFQRSSRLRRSDLGLPDDARVAGVVAGLRPEKAHDIFLLAADIVRERMPNSHFLLIGDGPERERLARLTDDLRLSDRVHFLGRRNDVADILPLLDLSVLPSRTEAFPLAILESMAAGRPVVATDVGSLRDMVVDGETGLLVPAADEWQLAEAMTALFADPSRAHAMGEAGRARAQQFGVKRMVQQIEDLFESLVASSGAVHGFFRSA
jgi:glycosyltransferase involved in cell wall biosynthesis